MADVILYGLDAIEASRYTGEEMRLKADEFEEIDADLDEYVSADELLVPDAEVAGFCWIEVDNDMACELAEKELIDESQYNLDWQGYKESQEWERCEARRPASEEY